MNVFLEEHRKFLFLLIKNRVDFILIGGYAVIIYGYERGTGDMDIWLKPSNENKVKFVVALQEHGIEEESCEAVRKMNFEETLVFHIGAKPNKIDFLTRVQGLSYDAADTEKKTIALENQLVPVVDYHHLIVMKMLAGRLQDKADIDILQKINKFKNK